jgi:hypothetical protein
MTWAKRITRSRDQQWERTMPLPALVFQVATKESARLDAVEGWDDQQLKRVACSLASGFLTGEKIRAETAAGGESVEELKASSVALRTLLEGDTDKAARYCLLGRIKAYGTPVNGWPRGGNNAEYARGVNESFYALPELVGRVVGDVEKLGDGIQQTELEPAILAAIDKHAPSYWSITKEVAQRAADGRPVPVQLDYTGKSSAPVHFVADGGLDYQGGPQGWQISQYGTQWLSGTHVLGNSVTLAVNISQTASMEKASTSENTRDGTSTDRSSQGVEIR